MPAKRNFHILGLRLSPFNVQLKLQRQIDLTRHVVSKQVVNQAQEL